MDALVYDVVRPLPFATPDSLRAMSRDIIRLLEKHIHDEFGCSVRVGTELEFSVIPSDDYLASGHNDNPFGVIYDRDKNTKPTKFGARSANKYNGEHDASDYFPHSPYICSIYKECKPFVYEVVLSHEAPHSSPLCHASCYQGDSVHAQKTDIECRA